MKTADVARQLQIPMIRIRNLLAHQQIPASQGCSRQLLLGSRGHRTARHGCARPRQGEVTDSDSGAAQRRVANDASRGLGPRGWQIKQKIYSP